MYCTISFVHSELLSSIVHYPLISFIFNLYLWYEWFDNVVNSFMNPSAWFLSRMESYCFQVWLWIQNHLYESMCLFLSKHWFSWMNRFIVLICRIMDEEWDWKNWMYLLFGCLVRSDFTVFVWRMDINYFLIIHSSLLSTW